MTDEIEEPLETQQEIDVSVVTYVYSSRENSSAFKFIDGILSGEVGGPFESQPAEYVHSEDLGLKEARARVSALLPSQIRLSMTSYAIKIIATGKLAENQEDFTKFAALDIWEEETLLAGKNNTPWPDTPEWLEEFSKGF